jgi:NADP-dependent 3-hydroxy acid dehydrogenase YdfG
VTKRADAGAFVESALQASGRLDVLVNNAGVMLVDPMVAVIGIA